MANEIITSDLVTNGGLVSFILSDLVLEKLYDGTDPSSTMLRVPWESRGGKGVSVTLDAAPAAYGAQSAGGGTETTAVLNAAYTPGKVELTPARYFRAYEMTDRVLLDGSVIGVETLAANLAKGVGMTLTSLLCGAVSGLTNTVGSTTADVTVDTIFDASFQLNNTSNFGRYTLILRPQQMNAFRSSLRAESGAVQFRESTFEALASRGPGYQGEWSNIDFWIASAVNAGAVAGYENIMMSFGCFAYTLMDPRIVQQGLNPADVVLANEALLIEKNRDPAAGMSQYIANLYPAVGNVEDDRGVRVLSA